MVESPVEGVPTDPVQRYHWFEMLLFETLPPDVQKILTEADQGVSLMKSVHECFYADWQGNPVPKSMFLDYCRRFVKSTPPNPNPKRRKAFR